MAVSPELGDILEKFPAEPTLTKWLAGPKTVGEFEKLKSDLFEIILAETLHDLCLCLSQALIFDGFGNFDPKPIDIEGFMKDAGRWKDTTDHLVRIAAELRIQPQENIDDIHREREKKPGERQTGHQLWRELEYGPRVCESCNVHNSLAHLTRDLSSRRGDNAAIPIRRLGMIIGDFRVGDHSAHGDFIYEAKRILGSHGELLVISPSKRSILATTPKTSVWDDGERLYRLSTQRYVDHVWIADIPEAYLSKPHQFWKYVWGQVGPDFIFLGEAEHPLQRVYELQSQILGGILIIDNRPVTRRSEGLLRVN